MPDDLAVFFLAQDEQSAESVMGRLTTFIGAAQQTLDFAVVTGMALAETGRFDDAASLQQQVLAQLPASTETQLRQQLLQTLRVYQQHQALRRPWSPVEPMELLDQQQATS